MLIVMSPKFINIRQSYQFKEIVIIYAISKVVFNPIIY